MDDLHAGQAFRAPAERPIPRSPQEMQRQIVILNDKIDAAEGTACELRYWLTLSRSNPHRTKEFLSLIELLEQEAAGNKEQLVAISTQLQKRLTGDSSIDGYAVISDPHLPPSIAQWLDKCCPRNSGPQLAPMLLRKEDPKPEREEIHRGLPQPVMLSLGIDNQSRGSRSSQDAPHPSSKSSKPPPPPSRPSLSSSDPFSSDVVAGLTACIVCGYGVPPDQLIEHVNSHFSPRKANAAPRSPAPAPNPQDIRFPRGPPTSAQQPAFDPTLHANEPMFIAKNNAYFICPSCNQSFPREALKLHTAVCVFEGNP